MWLFTQYGFFSVVCAHDLKGKGHTPDPNQLMVRARVQGHLRNLQARFPSLEPYAIQLTPRNDYRYRIIVPKSVWAEVAKELAEGLDYSNFKGQCASSGHTDLEYENALHEVWDIHRQLQETRGRPS